MIGGLYPTICLINHSCLPNAHNSWNSDTKCETFHATSYINSGEEITISYDAGGPSDSRRMHLKDAFGFDCDCGLCSLSLPELQISDARRLQIQHLDDAIGDSNRVMNRPDDFLADCHSLLQVLEEEYHGGGGKGGTVSLVGENILLYKARSTMIMGMEISHRQIDIMVEK